MPELPLDRSKSHVARQIQGNLIAYMNLFSGLPNMVTHDGDVYWFISHKPAPGNSVLRVTWSEENVDQQIGKLFLELGQHVAEIDWMVFPHDQPANLGKYLEARGMVGGRGGNWLWADLSTLLPTLNVSPDFRIEQVRDDAMMAEWVCASEAGFGGELSCFYEAYARHGYGDDAFSLHYIGYWGNIPVTSGTLLDAGGGASIYDLSTPPAYRGKGFGGALTLALMAEIRRRGYADTWIWSSNMAQSLYRTLGYVDADFGLREYHWHK
ncbi:MAG: GNAT family N-acetyltransferase [Chloroflexi bacterium]|nr:GNAT family N-acetyltransferase [Chloroflexota bacterium]MCC6891581.1 GNAT family N-acetyltransferase [Anaerolineae bacterium]